MIEVMKDMIEEMKDKVMKSKEIMVIEIVDKFEKVKKEFLNEEMKEKG